MISSPDRPAHTGDQDSAEGDQPADGNGHGQHHNHSFERVPEPDEKSVRIVTIATIVGTVFTVIGCVVSVITLVVR